MLWIFPEEPSLSSGVYPAKSGEINVHRESKEVGNHRVRTRRAVFQLKIYTLQKAKQNSSAFLLGYSPFDLSSHQGGEQFFRRQEESLFFITKQRSQCRPMPKNMLQILSVANRACREGLCSSVSACLATLFCPSCQMENKSFSPRCSGCNWLDMPSAGSSLLRAWEGINTSRITENEDTNFGSHPKPFSERED